MTKENSDNLYNQRFDDPAADYRDGYDDGVYDDGASGEAAASRTSGGGGGAHAKKGGLPLRGLAMVLIAVAVTLGLWGLYAMISEDDNSTVASDSAHSTSNAPTHSDQEGNGPGVPADGSRDGAPNQLPPAGEGDAAHPHAGAEGEVNRDPAARGEGSDHARNNARAGGHHAPPVTRDRNDIKVSVLNNSGESDKAKNEADVLKASGFKVGYVGNLPGEVLTVPKTTVFYPEGDVSAESLAREVAARYQAEVKTMNKDLPKEATDDGAVVVALAVPQA
ncbi:LytR family transcriptional regulator [Corynebacterium macginleyi]|uniref:LytR C-terminal domain-containing protein n=1 Tax=Corynebacterium macginleyi TaxID=38290 RepID=UPI00190A17D6|nr:LytR C-terminal domain-containing protein [Corynebacterium macginleyi]MBK4139658.1 LytR family transcriptional regulator [Corynebacterium macginleyi]MBK4161712.1 LytR family transcriptional regulator [Corynebacterium macginleyi]MBK4182655.1 LytR family transcriptional regulator [Corynebacterium macginleyi]